MDVDLNGTPPPRTISIQPRPRNPAQLIAMLMSIKKFDGVDWWAKDDHGDLVSQNMVGDAIKDSQSFDIVPKSEKTMQYRTYVTMNPPTLGFAYIGDDKKLHITKAGLQAAKSEDLDVLFTKQMIKWQYPSNSHGGSGGKGASSFPLRTIWSIHPFVSIIRICIMLENKTGESTQGYLSKEEIATFVTTMQNDNEVDKICDEILRLRKDTIKARGNQKKKMRIDKHKEKLRIAYKQDIEYGNYKIRQRKTNTVDEFLETKINNTNDYADTIIRYCRFTGLFASSDRVRRLIINPHQKWKAIEISKEETFLNLNKNIDDKEKYFSWFGDPSIPILPWESREGHLKEIKENLKNICEYLQIMMI
jgi:hypothetical protein